MTASTQTVLTPPAQGAASPSGLGSVLCLCLSGKVEEADTAIATWKRKGMTVEKVIVDPAGALSLAGEMALIPGWCMLRMTDHPEFETAGFNRLERVSAAQVWRVDGLVRALKSLVPQVIVVERNGPTLYEITRFGADLWQSRQGKKAGGFK